MDGGVTFMVNPSGARCGTKFLSPTTVWGKELANCVSLPNNVVNLIIFMCGGITSEGWNKIEKKIRLKDNCIAGEL